MLATLGQTSEGRLIDLRLCLFLLLPLHKQEEQAATTSLQMVVKVSALLQLCGLEHRISKSTGLWIPQDNEGNRSNRLLVSFLVEICTISHCAIRSFHIIDLLFHCE